MIKKPSLLIGCLLLGLFSGCGSTALAPLPAVDGLSTIAFTGLDSVATYTTGAVLKWTIPAEGAAGFLVYDLSTDTQTYLASVSPTQSSYTINGLTAGNSYKYLVRLIDKHGFSDLNDHVITIAPSSSPATSAYKQAVLADSPVAYWRIGETSGTTGIDQVSTHHLLYGNGGTPAYQFLGPALNDQGSLGIKHAYGIYSPTSTITSALTNMSIEEWIFPLDNPGTGLLFYVGNGASSGYGLQGLGNLKSVMLNVYTQNIGYLSTSSPSIPLNT